MFLLHLAVLFIQLPAWMTPWFSRMGDPPRVCSTLHLVHRGSMRWVLNLSHQKPTELTSKVEDWLDATENHPTSISHHSQSYSLDLLCTWRDEGVKTGCVNQSQNECIWFCSCLLLANQNLFRMTTLMGDVVQIGVSQRAGFV